MTDRQENKRSMYLAVGPVVNEFNAAWAGMPAFVSAFADFNTVLGQIEAARGVQETATEGVTVDKENAKYAAVGLGVKMASAVFAYASFTNNETLKAQVNYSYSELNKSRDTILIDRLNVIYNAGNANIASLADYGIIPTDVTDLETAITNYSDQVADPRNAIVQGSMATDFLAEAFANADAILKERLDKLMEVLRASNMAFYAKYKKARIIVDLRGGGAGGTDTPLPPTP